MREITIARRKYQKETYTFILNLPEYKGETGCIGIEIKPYISVETPENALGYTDTFLYNEQENDGYFLHISLSTHSIKSVAKSIAKKVDKFNKEQDLTLYMKNFCKNIQNGYSFIVRCVCSYGKSSKIIESQMIIEMVALQKNILIKYAHNLHRELYEFLLQALSTINDYINGPILSIYELVPIQRIYQIFIKLFCEWKAHNFDNDYDFGPFIEKYEASTTIFEETKNAIDAIGECLKNKSQLTFTKYLTEISKLMLFEDNVCNFPDSALEFIIHQLEEDDFVEEFRQMFNSSPTVKDELEK